MGSYWYRIDLESAPDYDPWKPDSLTWARSIAWPAVNAEALRLLDSLGPDGDLRAAATDLQSNRSSAGLESLLYDPMDIEDVEIYNGGHRATAMREQGQRFTLGFHFEAD